MAGRTRNPLDFGLGERGFVQRFILAEILGPPRARSRVAPPHPPVDEPAQDATRPADREASAKRSG